MTTPTEDALNALARGNNNYGYIEIAADTLRALIEPPTADEREALKVALTEGYWKRTGYRVTWENIGPLMDAILAAGFRRQVSHPEPEPVTDEMVKAATKAIAAYTYPEGDPGSYTAADHEQYARILATYQAARLPQHQTKENNMEQQGMMRCEHDWGDGACGAVAPEGTPGREQRHGNSAVYWLCPQSIAELSPDAAPHPSSAEGAEYGDEGESVPSQEARERSAAARSVREYMAMLEHNGVLDEGDETVLDDGYGADRKIAELLARDLRFLSAED